MKKDLYAVASGIIFAFGLVISGMTQPAKVISFLNIGAITNGISWQAVEGFWDPSLALVMGGALMATLIGFALTSTNKAPWAAAQFHIPTTTTLDRKLVAGATLFGIGWALAGYCPGPAIATLLTGGLDVAIFAFAMVVGMVYAKRSMR